MIAKPNKVCGTLVFLCVWAEAVALNHAYYPASTSGGGILPTDSARASRLRRSVKSIRFSGFSATRGCKKQARVTALLRIR